MRFIKHKTKRGFAVNDFKDDYGVKCNIQISSTVEPHIWLGVQKPRVSIMYKDAKALGFNLQKNHPETNEYGWCDFPIPEKALIESRMHLNREQSFSLALKLLKFALCGRL